MRITELDPETTVYKMPGDREVVHLSRHCSYVASKNVWAAPAGRFFQDLRLCSNCDPSNDHFERVRMLEEADPNDWP